MNRSPLSLLLVVSLLPVSLSAVENPTAVDRIIAEGRDNSQVMAHLDHICNRLGPRLSSSDGLTNACNWAVETFAEMGLEARLEQWGEYPVGFNRGPSWGRMVEPEVQTLEFGTNAWTAGTQGRQRAPARLLPPDDADEAAWQALAGTWVLIERPARGRGIPREERAAAQERYEASIARLDELGVAGYIRSTRDELIVTSGNHRIDWENLPTTPQIDLRNDQWQEIAERLGNGEEVELEFDIRNHFKKGPIPEYNVIADIPGSEFPDEYVIVGGHLDSWDAATGATDNGEGCATTIEAARLLMAAGVKPKRTIRFMLWTGEEQGLFGSRAYVEANPDEVAKTSAVLVHDGGTNYVSGIRCTKDMIEDMQQVFAPAMELDPRTPFEIEEVDEIRGSSSDHAPFIRAGCPGFFWNQAGRAVYRQTHHTQYDTYDTVVPEYQQHSAIVIALGAYGLAELDHLLSRASFEADE